MTRASERWAERLLVLVQPDGRLAVWSTTARRLVVRDATDEETTDHLTAWYDGQDPDAGPPRPPRVERQEEERRRRARQAARWAVSRARQGLQPRAQLPRWEDAVRAGAGDG